MIGNAFNPLTTFNWVNSAAFGAWAVGLALATELIAARLVRPLSAQARGGGSVTGAAPHPRATTLLAGRGRLRESRATPKGKVL